MNYIHSLISSSFSPNMIGFNSSAISSNPTLSTFFFIAVAALAIWSLVWKGFALWHAARNHQRVWYIALLILNTLGILEIIYLLFFRKNKNNLVRTTTVTKTVSATTPGPDAPVVVPPTA
jgi:hypothetical protein